MIPFSMNVMAAIKIYKYGRIYVKKLWVEEEYTHLYRTTGFSPKVGCVLQSGVICVEKYSDDNSIILFINKDEQTLRKEV